jgi:(S)-2-hydroxyglutarate dehydrogenase
MSTPQTDVCIVGGGIVGLATAYRLTEMYPGKHVTVLEKEQDVGHHQTGHNSGVLHSGIYYKPGTLRAQNCRAGKAAMENFCRREGIPFDLCGKVIVAVDESELAALDRIYDRGQQNGVTCSIIDRARLLELEPHVAGIKAIHVPEAGIVDYKQVCTRFGEILQERGGALTKGAKVTGFREQNGRVIVQSTAGDVDAAYVVTCTGLHADRTARQSGQPFREKVVPFRGEYFDVKPEAHHLVRGLIYPVPDTRFPFLGVHFTKTIHGGLDCGPNAVLAFAREGYRKYDINVRDLCESLTYIGFLRMAMKYWRTGLNEMWRSVSKGAFVKALQRLIPEIRAEHLVTAPAGVRAQALGRDGTLVDDFLILESERIVNVCNAPSPAATASLNVGKLVVEKLATRF